MEVAVANIIEMSTLYISAAILIIAICIIMFSAWKLSRSRIDDADLADRIHDLLDDTIGDYSEMREWYNDCQNAMIENTKKLTAANRDITLLENVIDKIGIESEDIRDQMIKLTSQMDAITSENKQLAEEKHAAYEVIHMLYNLFIDAIATIKELKGDPPELPREFIIFYDKNIKDSFKGD